MAKSLSTHAPSANAVVRAILKRWGKAHDLARRGIAFGRAVIRWSQMGFGRTSKTTSKQQTPRNLMGFKDGTNNILLEDRAGTVRCARGSDA